MFIKPAAFDWGPGTIAALDSSFFWGYLVTQVPGGYLAAKFPANKYVMLLYYLFNKYQETRKRRTKNVFLISTSTIAKIRF